jgi:hypothetical protein
MPGPKTLCNLSSFHGSLLCPRLGLMYPAWYTRSLSILAIATALLFVVACGGGDDDDVADDEEAAQPATPEDTADVADEGARSADQDALDAAIATYFDANFPGEPSYKGDCETLTQASCSQFRALDADGLEYFIVGDPATFEAVAWIIVQRAGTGWEVVGHDLSRGWARGDDAVVAPGDCQDVLPEPGSGQPIECLEPASVVTVTGGPRLAGNVLYFRIGENRWILGVGLCDPAVDEDCAPAS